MSTRFFAIKKDNNLDVRKCPKCGNNTIFLAHSDYCAEDCCEVWVECKCGFDPTAEHGLYRFENVFGGCTDDNISCAISCWGDAIDAEYSDRTKCPHGVPDALSVNGFSLMMDGGSTN